MNKSKYIETPRFNIRKRASNLFYSFYNRNPFWTNNSESLEQNFLRSKIKSNLPELFDFSQKIKKRLEEKERFVIVQNFPFLEESKKLRDATVFSLCLCIGKPTPTDVHENKIIWDVAPRIPKKNYTTTFSENYSEAGLHTDNQYRKKPERYVALFVVQAAKKGGINFVVDGKEVIRKLKISSEGKKCVGILESNKFPFRVPTAYTKRRRENTPEIIFKPIISGNSVRFRLDTIMGGFECCPNFATPGRLWAVNYFSKYLENYPRKFFIKLKNGEILFVNNHEILHGRTSFKDAKRHLLRVRIAA